MTRAVLVLAAVLDMWNWYLRPERVFAWVAVLVVLAAMAVALRIDGRRSKDAVMLAALIVTICLVAPLAAAFGFADRDFAERATMVITGAFFTVTGNALPKVLMPLSAHGDPARTQACRRTTGWIWALTGLGVTGVGLVLPMDTAAPASIALMASGVVGTVVQIVRLRRPRQREA